MRLTGRGAVIAVGAAAALVAVIVALPGGSHPSTDGARQLQAAVIQSAAEGGTKSGAPTESPKANGPVTIPALPAPSRTADGPSRAAAGTGTDPANASSDGAASGTPSTATGSTSSTRHSTSTKQRAAHRSRPGTSPSPSTTTTAPATSRAPTSTSRVAPSTSSPPPRTPTTTASPPRSTAAPTTSSPPRTSTSTPKPAPTPKPKPKPTTTSSKPKPPNFGIDVSVGNARQIITVTASSSSATTGTLRAWQQNANGTWTVVHGPYQAWLGSAGIGHQSEGSTRTPLGTFTLTEAFGKLADPGTALPYHRTSPNDWWVSDVHSKLYNTLQNCSSCSFNTSVAEHLFYITPYYDYAVVMDVNRWPAVPGDGSAFFLHITDHRPTAGCVAIDEGALLTLMRWLDPARHPRIATGIG